MDVITIESVAEPAPSLACTTSSPPNWMRCVRALMSSSEKFAPSTWLVCHGMYRVDVHIMIDESRCIVMYHGVSRCITMYHDGSRVSFPVCAQKGGGGPKGAFAPWKKKQCFRFILAWQSRPTNASTEVLLYQEIEFGGSGGYSARQ